MSSLSRSCSCLVNRKRISLIPEAQETSTNFFAQSVTSSWHQRCRTFLENKKYLDEIEFNLPRNKHNDEKRKRYLDFFLAICSLKSTNGTYISHQSPLNFERGQLKEKRGLLKQLFCLFIHLFSVMLIINFVLIAIVHYKRDRAMDNWTPTRHLNKSDILKHNCTVYDVELYANNEEDLKSMGRIQFLNQMMLLLNDASLRTNGATIVSYVILATVHLSYFYNGYLHFHSQKQLRVDVIAFLVNPIKERQRIYRELTDVFRSLIESVLVSAENDRMGIESQITCKSEVTTDFGCEKYSVMGDSRQGSPRRNLQLDGGGQCSQGRAINESPGVMNRSLIEMRIIQKNDVKSYIELITDLMQSDAIQPENVSIKWHRNLSRVYHRVLLWGFVFSLGSDILAIIFNLFIEINKRISQRFVEVGQCYNGSSLFEDDSRLELLRYNIKLPEINSIEIARFADYPNNQTILNYLILQLIELKHFLSLKNVLACLMIFISALLCSSWVCIYISQHVMCHYERLIWINQIVKQLQDCIKSMHEFIKRENSTGEERSEPNGDKRFHLLQLHNSILATYLNYELFRRQQKKFQSLSNFLVSQGAWLCAVTMFTVYVIGTTIRTDSTLIMIFLATYMVGYINIYLICAALVTQKIERLRVGLMELIARSVSTPLQFTYLFDLIKRQLVSLMDAHLLFAPNILGINLSYEKLMTINSWLIALSLILVRANV